MKKFEVSDLREALLVIPVDTKNPVLIDFAKSLRKEIEKRDKPKFIKATDAYLENLKNSDITVRMMKENDDFYYPGMYGMFEKATGKLLRRHTDTGFLLLPKDRREVFGK